MITILYITRTKLELSRAHTQNILKTAEALDAGNYARVTVFSSQKSEIARDILAEKGIKNRTLVDVSGESRSLLVAIWRRRKSFDILYFRDPYLFFVAFFARVLGRKVLFEVHGSHEWRFGRPFWFLSLLVSHGAIFITHGLKEYYAYRKPSCVAYPLGVDLELYKQNALSSEERKRLGFPSEKIIIMYVGSFLWYSIPILVEMLNFVSEECFLVIVGAKQEEITHIKEVAVKHGVSKKILCLSRVLAVQVPAYLLSADILVNPLLINYPGSISSKLFEYLAAAKPIVTSAGGANRELIKDGFNGLVIDPMTPENFGEAIQKIVDDKKLAEKFAHNARMSAGKYTWHARTKHITELLKII